MNSRIQQHVMWIYLCGSLGTIVSQDTSIAAFVSFGGNGMKTSTLWIDLIKIFFRQVQLWDRLEDYSCGLA